MQFKAALVLSLFAAVQVALAQPPACLLAALNQQPNPADVKSICSNKASDVQKAIQSTCSGADKSTALSSFADTCKGAGVTVKSPPAESSSASASGNTKPPPSNSNLVTSKGATETAKPASTNSVSANNLLTSSSVIGTAKASGTTSGAAATGFTEGGKTGSGSSSASAAGASSTAKTGDAGRMQVGSFAGLVVAAAGVVYVL